MQLGALSLIIVCSRLERSRMPSFSSASHGRERMHSDAGACANYTGRCLHFNAFLGHFTVAMFIDWTDRALPTVLKAPSQVLVH